MNLYIYKDIALYTKFSLKPEEPIPPQYYKMYRFTNTSDSKVIDIVENGFYFFAVDNPHEVEYQYKFNLSLYYYSNADYNDSCIIDDTDRTSCMLNIIESQGSSQCLLAYTANFLHSISY